MPPGKYSEQCTDHPKQKWIEADIIKRVIVRHLHAHSKTYPGITKEALISVATELGIDLEN